MSKLNELINKLCPHGVVFDSLSNAAVIKRGVRVTKQQLADNGKYVCVSGGTQPMGRINSFNRDANTITISSYGAAGYVGFVKEKFWANDVCLCVFPSNKLNNRFLYHVLKNYQTYLYSKTTHAIPDHIPTEVISNLVIPIPPMDVQREVVRILDVFTEITGELAKNLTEELTARRKQYEYYRDWLFENIDSKHIVKLGSFAQILRGGNFQKSDFVETGKPCIHYGQIYTHFGIHTDTVLKYLPESIFNISKKANPGDIVMAVTSENIEDVCKCVAWIGYKQIAVSGHTAIIQHNQNPKYLSYFFHSSMFFNQKVKYAHGTKVIEITPSSLVNIDIPLPSLEVQQKIVDILDTFDGLITNISIGIPSEIDGRTQQYEYYRDKLLTFKELKA